MTAQASSAFRHAVTNNDALTLASIKEESMRFLKGDSNAPWAILAETVIGCVPVLGQLVDARDIIKALAEVSGAPNSPLAWFNLITALIGLIPGGGDAVKKSARAIKSGALPPDDLLALIRKVYKGDPEKLLQEMLDAGKLRGKLDEILTSPNLTKQLSAEARQSINRIRTNLNRQFAAFKQEVEGWLRKGRKTSSETGPATKAKSTTPSTTPHSKKGTGSDTQKDHSNTATTNANNTATQRQQRFKTLSQKVLGVLGEHMADYHCQEIKGWGEAATHDGGHINTAKLNDGGELVQLWPIRVRGRGIDAVWKTSSSKKPYAIIEAKASYDLTKSLNRLLAEAGDKTESAIGDKKDRKKNGRFGNKGNAASSDFLRQTNGKVTQMSHAWIEKRLPGALRFSPTNLINIRKEKFGQKNYSRHVLFFSIPHAAAHAEALILHTAQRQVAPPMHSTHQVTCEWGDNAIEKIVDRRAGFAATARDKRTR